MGRVAYGATASSPVRQRSSGNGGGGGGISPLVIVLIIVATAVIIGGVFAFIYFRFLKPEPVASGQLMVDTSASDTGEKKSDPLAGRMVSFVGINDATLAEGDTVALENLPENDDFMMRFLITDTDTNEEVFTTDLIPSGKSVIWVPSDYLEKGVHHLAFLQTPFWLDENGEYIPLTAGNNEVELTIE